MANEWRAAVSFGSMLQALRAEHHKAGKWLSSKGISPTLIRFYEGGEQYPTFDKANIICRSFGLVGLDRIIFMSAALNRPVDEPRQRDHYRVLNAVIAGLASLDSDEHSHSAYQKLIVALDEAYVRHETARRAEVQWAVVPVAGWQSVFLPHEQTARLVERAIKDAVECGINKFVVVIAPSQQKALKALRKRPPTEIVLRKQDENSGLAHAINLAKPSIDGQPFAVILPDDWAPPDRFKELIGLYNLWKCSIVALRFTKKGLTQQSALAGGVASLDIRNKRGLVIKTLAESPTPSMRTQARYTIFGRYILTPNIFDVMRELPPNPRTNKVELTDALNELAKSTAGGVVGCLLKGRNLLSIADARRGLRQQIEKIISA